MITWCCTKLESLSQLQPAWTFSPVSMHLTRVWFGPSNALGRQFTGQACRMTLWRLSRTADHARNFQSSEPFAMEPSPKRVFEDTSADLFAFAGNSYLVYVDRLSGWPSLRVWNKRDPTSRDVIRVLREFFTVLGVPVRFRMSLLTSCRGGEYSMLHLHLIIRNTTAWRS